MTSVAPDMAAEDGQQQPQQQEQQAADKNYTDHQSNVLPHKRLMIVFPALALTQFTAYLDQNSVSAAAPVIANSLNLGSALSWVATSYLLATTAVQLINGRLSDIFGRKILLLGSLGILAIGNLIGGFSQNPAMLFACRCISGLGGGSITALVQIIASDITTLKQRGKYNGFIGAAVSFGSGLGPLIGGVVTTKASWRWSMWYDVPWLSFLVVLLAILLPQSKIDQSMSQRVKSIDWTGLLLSVLVATALTVPLSGGGATFPWDGPVVITLLVVGVVGLLVFLVVEKKFAKLPIVPLHLFQADYSCNILLAQQLLWGFVFWSNLYYIPIYLENVRGHSSLIAGAIVVPMASAQGIGSIISGQVISRTGKYNAMIIGSQFLWTIGLGVQASYTQTYPVWAICVVGFFQGLGCGGCFQPSLVAILAHSRRADRAVLNSLRNFLRTFGGSLGLAISGTVVNNVLRSKLQGEIPENIIQQVTASTAALNQLNISADQRAAIIDAYMAGIHTIFIIYVPLIGICALAALLVRDQGLAEKDTSGGLAVEKKKKAEAAVPIQAAPSVPDEASTKSDEGAEDATGSDVDEQKHSDASEKV